MNFGILGIMSYFNKIYDDFLLQNRSYTLPDVCLYYKGLENIVSITTENRSWLFSSYQHFLRIFCLKESIVF